MPKNPDCRDVQITLRGHALLKRLKRLERVRTNPEMLEKVLIEACVARGVSTKVEKPKRVLKRPPGERTHFGMALKRMRMERELSVRDLARLVGLTPGYISNVENGHDRVPTEARVRQLAAVLGADARRWVELARL